MHPARPALQLIGCFAAYHCPPGRVFCCVWSYIIVVLRWGWSARLEHFLNFQGSERAGGGRGGGSHESGTFFFVQEKKNPAVHQRTQELMAVANIKHPPAQRELRTPYLIHARLSRSCHHTSSSWLRSRTTALLRTHNA